MIDRLNAALEGRYRIERKLGEGGMASVFLAEDLKHDRKVAIKVLKPELAAVIGGERFVTEIRTTASLQHPHILPLFDSGADAGFLYYVMPYVDGESLRERLDREKQLSVSEAVGIATDVASALHYAHEQGVVHRDIKPANILLHAGQPVVADFGIALAISAAGGGRLTETGMSVGTPHYMSPEQASADRDVSARSDTYALGCVLYEMLAGDPPHTGSTAQAVLMRILTEDPRDLAEVRRSVPEHVRDAVTKALEKLPADRFDSAEAFRQALTDESFRYTSRPRPRPATAQPREQGGGWTRDTRTRALLGVSLLLLAALGWLALRAPGAGNVVPQPSHRFLVTDSLLAPNDPTLAVSTDGDLVYAGLGADGEGPRLRIRRASNPRATAIPSTSGAGFPTFSPDGRWLAFNADGQVRKVQLTTGTQITLIPEGGVGPIFSVEWASDGTVITAGEGGIHRVPDTGGETEQVSEEPAVYARLLPGGRKIVYTAIDQGPGNARVKLLDLETGDTSTVAPQAGNAFWSPTGHLLYGHRSGTIFAIPFDPDRGEATGAPVPVQERVLTFGAIAFFSVAESGVFAYREGVATGVDLDRHELLWVEMDGATAVLPLEPTDHPDVRVSPDGSQLAYTRDGHIHLFDLHRGTNQRLTFEGENHHDPVWSPDGQRLAFAAEREDGRGGTDIYVKHVDGRSPAQWVAGFEGFQYPADWLEDGTITLFSRVGLGAQTDIYMARVGSDADAVPLLTADWNEAAPRVSPGGRLLAYISEETGEPQVFLREFPDMRGRWQISAAPALAPLVWSRDGSAVFYRDRDTGRLLRAQLELEPTFRVVNRVELADRMIGVPRDLHPDGQRLLLTRQLGAVAIEEAEPDLVVVTNWFNELRRRLGQEPR